MRTTTKNSSDSSAKRKPVTVFSTSRASATSETKGHRKLVVTAAPNMGKEQIKRLKEAMIAHPTGDM